MLSTRASLLAENLFLRRQLALFQERKTKPRRTTPSTRLAMLALARFFDWREALTVVKPETFLKWHRTGFKLFWRWKSRNPGRPPLPKNIAELVRRVTQEKPTWGEQRIANKFSIKLGNPSPGDAAGPGTVCAETRLPRRLRNCESAVLQVIDEYPQGRSPDDGADRVPVMHGRGCCAQLRYGPIDALVDRDLRRTAGLLVLNCISTCLY